jgi:hypothetical protein
MVTLVVHVKGVLEMESQEEPLDGLELQNWLTVFIH